MVSEIKMLHQMLNTRTIYGMSTWEMLKTKLTGTRNDKITTHQLKRARCPSELVIFDFYTCIPNKQKDQKLQQHVGASAALFCLTLTRIPYQTTCDICWHFIWITDTSIRMQLFIDAFDVLRECSYIPYPWKPSQKSIYDMMWHLLEFYLNYIAKQL